MWNNVLIILCTALLNSISSINARDTKEGMMGPQNIHIGSSRIIGGLPANRIQFPQQVSLRLKSTGIHFCAGSILTPDWVLTAAHCVKYYENIMEPNWIIVVAGDIYLNNVSTSHQSRNVARIVVHELYDEWSFDNDIALVLLKKKLNFDPYVNAVPLMTKVPSNAICQVSGWGVQKEGGQFSHRLLYINLPLIPRNNCKILLEDFKVITEGMICAGHEKGMKDTCQGDGGGGLLCNKYLTGIVSWGMGCARAKLPGVYTNVPFYMDWIRRQVDLKPRYSISSTPLRDSASSKLGSNLSFLMIFSALTALINL